jgi:hypothetical protein
MRHSMACLAIASALLVGAMCSARADETDGTIEMLEGGTLTSGFRMSLGFLYGAGCNSGGLGSPVSTVGPGIASVSGNPAGLTRLRANAVLIDVLPPFGTSASAFIDFDGIAGDALDDAVEDIAAPGFSPGYPHITADVGQQGGILSGAVGLRLDSFVVGAAVEEPVNAALDMLNNGLEAFGHTSKEDGEGFTDISLRVMADAAADLSFEVSKTTIAAATQVRDGLSVGLSLSRYHALATASAHVRADGIIDYGGQEYAFNDPSDPWNNTLGFESTGSYEGDGYGCGLGVSWTPLAFLTFGSLFVGTSALTLNGSLTSIEDAMPGAVEGEFELDQILDSQPTLTERTVTVENDPVTLRLPSYIGFAASFDVPVVVATLEYRKYMGAFGFDYQDLREGLDVSHGLGIELDFGPVRVGGGAILGKTRGEAIEGKEAGQSVVVPMANLGAGVNLGSNLRVDSMLLALPMQIARVSLTYAF